MDSVASQVGVVHIARLDKQRFCGLHRVMQVLQICTCFCVARAFVSQAVVQSSSYAAVIRQQRGIVGMPRSTA
jgi:hypothetical protein